MTHKSYHGGSVSSTPPLLTPSQAAAFLCLRPRTVRDMLRRGDLPGIRLGKQWRIRPEDVPGLEVSS